VDEESFAFGPFRLIPAQRVLLEDGKLLHLGGRALDILVMLLEGAGETIHKDRLIARIWPDTVVDEGALRVHVAALRKALGDGRAGKRYIASNPGRGSSFVAPVTRENRSGATAPPDTAAPGNLPGSLTRIVGRASAVATLAAHLTQRRFLTIVGPGGIGKTTVAVAIGEKVRAAYPDGVWLVGLAPVSDPGLVPSAVAGALGLKLSGERISAEAVARAIGGKNLLLILDNCEHVVGSAAVLAEAVLRAAPRIHLLATSREPLRAEGERLHRLASLQLPPPAAPLTAEEAIEYSAVELFNERATATVDGFVLDDSNASAVLEICRRLDGVPLALELAAARVETFGVQGLAARLDDRFGVLTKGRRTALPRRRTLRATIDWSYDLLPEAEKVILGRLAIFRGPFTIDAAASVAVDEQTTAADAIEGVANLAGKSLVTTDIMRTSDDPFPAARSAAYARSYDLRTAEAKDYPRTAPDPKP
jgi:predicted ATPase/DNA-binding winged helix-turn-helix (wHTH) protein